MIGLTPQQAQCLNAIKLLTENGVPPTYRELGDALGIASTNSVHRLVHGLVERGAIALEPERPRSIRVLDDLETEALHRRTSSYLRTLRERIDTILASRAPC